ncbi:MAG: hypothetical protein R2793_02875 [Flavobacteriaceae bacterium]
MKHIIFFIALAIFTSCSSTKKTTSSMADSTTTVTDSKKMMENGFLAGTIVSSQAEGDCPFVIEVQGADGAYFLDPVNLEESYKKGGEKIWFTFTGLRMMNRCEKATPVNINEIQKRAE